MKNVLISVGGNCESNVLDLKINFDEIIAVDSGIEHLNKFSLMPTVLIGDFDSISKDDYQSAVDNNIPIKTYQKNKDVDSGQSLTLRNETTENILKISCQKGKFVLIY